MAGQQHDTVASHALTPAKSMRDIVLHDDGDDDDQKSHWLPTKRDLKRWTAYTVLGAIIYACGYFCLGDFVLPGGKVFPILLVFVCAHVGGIIISKLYMPPLLGMLIAGVILVNIPGGILASADKKWLKEIKYGSLAVIFLRSGLEQDLSIFKRVGPVAVRLLLIPGIVEALVSGGVGIPVFGLPVMLSFAMGFLLKPCDPAIAMTMMYNIQQQNKGVAKGIPPLVVAAASFDDLVAICLYTLFISFALPPAEGQSQVFALLKGPLNIVFGIVLGAAGGLICSASKIWNTRLMRTVVVLFMALTQMYLAVKFDFSGAGVLSAIMLGVLVNTLWTNGWPRFLSQGKNPHYGTAVEHHVALFWEWVAEPLLFGLVGTAVDFHYINPSTIPKSLLVIMSGWAARCPATFFAVMGAGLTWKERLFVTLTWLPKATVQAALATSPLDQIMELGLDEAWVQMGDDIMVTALFAVLICGPLGVIASQLGAKYLLEPDPPTTVAATYKTQEEYDAEEPTMSLPSFVAEVDEVELVRQQDDYEDNVIASNDIKMGRLVMLLEQEIEDMQDLCAKDDAKLEVVENMHAHLRGLRHELLEREVPHSNQVHGARDFVHKTRMSASFTATAKRGMTRRKTAGRSTGELDMPPL